MYDIIGDIHGHYGKLEALLRRLNYRESDGAWRHAGRQAIFVGDLIDRGPGQVETVQAVRAMVEAGTAQCVMGNHEFNAIAWATPDPQRPGEYLRPRGMEKNRAQHREFLGQVGEDSARHREFVEWFRTLPLWLDLGGIRVVHACWHAPSLDWLGPQVGQDNALTESLLIAGSRRGHDAYRSIESLCKGLEVPLPQGASFRDKDGIERRETRIKWWDPQGVTFRQAAIVAPEHVDRIPDMAIPEAFRPQAYAGPPVFFGHYWLTGTPRLLQENVACLDYSVARGGPLVAYRWDGEGKLSADRFVEVQ